jgi:hypothetical protein
VHKDKGKKASSDGAYQDSVTAPLSRDHDEDITGFQDELEDDDDEDEPDDTGTPINPPPTPSAGQLKEVLTAVEKVNFVLSVRNMTNRRYTLAS